MLHKTEELAMSDKTDLAAREQLDQAVELLDSAQDLLEQAIGSTDVGYSFVQQIANLAAQIHSYEIVDPDDVRTVEVVVRVKIRSSADIDDVISNCNYEFIHDAIVDTEIVDINTEF
jgi:hypothetical protein